MPKSKYKLKGFYQRATTKEYEDNYERIFGKEHKAQGTPDAHKQKNTDLLVTKPDTSSEAGKGDSYRSVNKEKYDSNFDRIFGKKESKMDTDKKYYEVYNDCSYSQDIVKVAYIVELGGRRWIDNQEYMVCNFNDKVAKKALDRFESECRMKWLRSTLDVMTDSDFPKETPEPIKNK